MAKLNVKVSLVGPSHSSREEYFHITTSDNCYAALISSWWLVYILVKKNKQTNKFLKNNERNHLRHRHCDTSHTTQSHEITKVIIQPVLQCGVGLKSVLMYSSTLPTWPHAGLAEKRALTWSLKAKESSVVLTVGEIAMFPTVQSSAYSKTLPPPNNKSPEAPDLWNTEVGSQDSDGEY